MELTGVLNLVQNRDDAADPDAEKIEELIAQRAAAKKEKNFAEADRIRGVLADMEMCIRDRYNSVLYKNYSFHSGIVWIAHIKAQTFEHLA